MKKTDITQLESELSTLQIELNTNAAHDDVARSGTQATAAFRYLTHTYDASRRPDPRILRFVRLAITTGIAACYV